MSGLDPVSSKVPRLSDAQLIARGSAVISDCGTWRYWLERAVHSTGPVFVFAGVNGSTATSDEEDQTTRKWFGFTLRNHGSRYIAINPFAYRATDVRELDQAVDPVGPENDRYIGKALSEGDILVPCWGSRDKLPRRLRPHLDRLLQRMVATGKPILAFGLTASGDPKHPLMLGYSTPLVPLKSLSGWRDAGRAR